MVTVNPSRPMEAGGWISPEGGFYPTDANQHSQLAVVLSEHFYGSKEGDELLSRHKWVRLSSDGEVISHPWYSFTTAQLNALDAILANTESSSFKRCLEPCIKEIAYLLTF